MRLDRRHVVLGVALAASVATSSDKGTPPLFYGEQRLDADLVWLDETRATRTWVITTAVVLPAEAEHDDFTSETEVQARADDHQGLGSEDLIAVVLGACGSPGVDDGPATAAVVELDDSFVDCVPRQTCTRTFCAAIANGSEHPVEVEWYTRTIIESEAGVDDNDIEPITVPIDITIEEIEP